MNLLIFCECGIELSMLYIFMVFRESFYLKIKTVLISLKIYQSFCKCQAAVAVYSDFISK